jgi:putative transposase
VTEGAGAFRPLNEALQIKVALATGLSFMLPTCALAPQETRTYLVTAVTAQRRSLFQVTATAELLQQTILDYRSQGRFLPHAFVIMPDHFHALITPAPDVSLEKAMQFIKGGFSFRLKSKLDVWMRSFNESQIMSEEKFMNCVRYIEENPFAEGLFDAGSPSLQLRRPWPVGPHACPPARLILTRAMRPGPKGRPLSRSCSGA